MNILSTIHSKYQGETMFCFVCVATVFGYILGVNRVIDAIISKHSDETRVKIVKTLNKYTQTNFSEIAELLASNNLILSPTSIVNDVSSSSEQGDNNTNDSTNDVTNETIANLNSHDDNPDKQEKKADQEKQVQENTVMSPSSVSTSEEDYELVRKNENVNHLKNKTNMKYFEWLNIF
jgi:DNA-binding Lrp family transcriptional regulator